MSTCSRKIALPQACCGLWVPHTLDDNIMGSLFPGYRRYEYTSLGSSNDRYRRRRKSYTSSRSTVTNLGANRSLKNDYAHLYP